MPFLTASLPLLQSAPARQQTPPKSWIDPDTGHRVVRLTDVPGSASLYFNVPAYTADEKEMVFTTPNGISALDLATLKTRPVVRGRVRIVSTGHKTQNVYRARDDAGGLAVYVSTWAR